MGETSEVIPEMRLITPKAVATPARNRYLAIRLCLLTLSNPKVNPQKKRTMLARMGFHATVKKSIDGEVARIWKAKEISPPYLSTIFPLGR